MESVLLVKGRRRKFVLFWDITKRLVMIPYRRLGTTLRSHLQGSYPTFRENLMFKGQEILVSSLYAA
jgi:hypothetical protein